MLTGLLASGICPATAGDDGQVAVRMEISNATDAVLECQALAAHWYSFPVLMVAPGKSVAMAFSYAPTRGEVTDPTSRLPIEVLYCGRSGRAWATRSEILLSAAAKRAAEGNGRAHVACRAQHEMLACGAAPQR